MVCERVKVVATAGVVFEGETHENGQEVKSLANFNDMDISISPKKGGYFLAGDGYKTSENSCNALPPLCWLYDSADDAVAGILDS